MDLAALSVMVQHTNTSDLDILPDIFHIKKMAMIPILIN